MAWRSICRGSNYSNNFPGSPTFSICCTFYITTACQLVFCGIKVMKWEVGRGGVPDPEENKKKKARRLCVNFLKNLLPSASFLPQLLVSPERSCGRCPIVVLNSSLVPITLAGSSCHLRSLHHNNNVLCCRTSERMYVAGLAVRSLSSTWLNRSW